MYIRTSYALPRLLLAKLLFSRFYNILRWLKNKALRKMLKLLLRNKFLKKNDV